MLKPQGWSVIVAVLLVLAAGTPQALAQAARAEMTAQITAPDGAALPGANVTVRASSTNDVREVVTGETGYDSLTALPPDRYTVTVTLAGFRRFVQEPVRLTTGERVRLDVTLAIGALEESVIVSGDPAPLRAESGSLAQAVPNAAVVGLPLMGAAS